MKSEIRYIDTEKKKELYNLQKYNPKLYANINTFLDKIENDAFSGIQIPKKLIPKEYKKYGLKNLWKYNLPKGWRVIYSIISNDKEIYSIIIEFLSHKEYEKRFRY